MVNLAQKDIRNGKKGFANASDYLETWDDSDNITAVNAQNDLRHPAKWWHNCWKYALEAIIKVLLYFIVHDNCLVFML